MVTNYVAGFLFSTSGKQVALIQKTKPDWQKGKLNGIGGKIEEGETPLEAIRREFQEETGANVMEWRQFVEMRWRDAVIHFFVAHGDHGLTSITEEIVGWYDVDFLFNAPTLPNLRWLVPMALDKDIASSVTVVDYT